jgi:hypothetical protein
MSCPLDEQAWHRMTEEIMVEMREWRAQHPKATLREMETALDSRWARVRARLLEELALTSAAADWATYLPATIQPFPTAERPCCSAARTPAHSRMWCTLTSVRNRNTIHRSVCLRHRAWCALWGRSCGFGTIDGLARSGARGSIGRFGGSHVDWPRR